MKNGLLVVVVLLLAVSGWAQEKKAAPVTAEMKWITEDLFQVPESAVYDSVRDVIYVSNINGVPRQADYNGYISKVKPDGTLDELKWVGSLNAPKGMAIYGDKLYVADINRLVEIDIPKARLVGSVDLKATFLNDVAVDAEGTVYISDNMANKIYRVKDGQGEVWRQGDLGGPNGLLIQPDGLLYNAQSDGDVRRMAWETEKPVPWVKLAVGLDGIAACNDGFLVSAFDGEIWWVDAAGASFKILDTRDKNTQSADISYVPSLNLLLVPTFASNRLAAYQLNFK